MAATPIDRLEIKVEADTKKAVESLNLLKKALAGITAGASGKSLRDISDGAERLGHAARSASDSTAKLDTDISKLGNESSSSAKLTKELSSDVEKLGESEKKSTSTTEGLSDATRKIREEFDRARDSLRAYNDEYRKYVQNSNTGNSGTGGKVNGTNYGKGSYDVPVFDKSGATVGSAGTSPVSNIKDAVFGSYYHASRDPMYAGKGGGGGSFNPSAYVKPTTKSMDDFGKSTKKAGSATSYLLRTIKRFVIYKLLNNIIRSTAQGFQNLALESENANKVLSNYKSMQTDLGNSMANLLLPLMEAMYPIMSGITSLVAELGNASSQLSAAVKGEKTFKRLKKSAEEYLQTLQGITGFDEINTMKGGGDYWEDAEVSVGGTILSITELTAAITGLTAAIIALKSANIGGAIANAVGIGGGSAAGMAAGAAGVGTAIGSVFSKIGTGVKTAFGAVKSGIVTGAKAVGGFLSSGLGLGLWGAIAPAIVAHEMTISAGLDDDIEEQYLTHVEDLPLSYIDFMHLSGKINAPTSKAQMTALGDDISSADTKSLMLEQNNLLRMMLERRDSIDVTTLTTAFDKQNRRTGYTVVPVN